MKKDYKAMWQTLLLSLNGTALSRLLKGDKRLSDAFSALAEYMEKMERDEKYKLPKDCTSPNQGEADRLFTNMCELITLADPGKQCHEVQIRYKAILETIKDTGLNPRVPNFWSDGYNFFPIQDLLEFFHKNGWTNIKWIGDADCKKCFQMDLCEFCGTGKKKGKSTEEKHQKELHQKITDKILLLKVISEAEEKGVQLNDKTLHLIVLLCQAHGVPFSYKFEITPDKRIISRSDKPITDVVEEIE